MLNDGPDPSGAELPGAQRSKSHGDKGLGEVGSDAQHLHSITVYFSILQPSWTAAGVDGKQHLQNPAESSSPGRCHQ